MHEVLVWLGHQLGFVILGVLVVLKEAFLKWKAKRFSLSDETETSDTIRGFLHQIRERVNAQRAYVCLYKNGEKFTNGSAVHKRVLVYEVLAPGVERYGGNMREIQASLLPEENKLILEQGDSFTRVCDLERDRFQFLLRQGGVAAIARCALHRHGDVVGFVGLDFSNEERPAHIGELVDVSWQIEQALP